LSASAGLYWARTERTDRELDLIERYNTPSDNYFKLAKPPTKGRLCFYLTMTYYLMYDGAIQNRPEVAADFGRADLLRSDWRGMVYLPSLSRGEYDLVPEAFDGRGKSASLPPCKISITD
jgi:hypothetical protein